MKRKHKIGSGVAVLAVAVGTFVATTQMSNAAVLLTPIAVSHAPTPIIRTAAPLLQPVIITNSGSTNSAGYVLMVRGDGSGSITRFGSTNNYKDFSAKHFSVTNIAATLSKIGNVSAIKPASACMKSVSFGTSESLTYGMQTTGDLNCNVSTVANGSALQTEVQALIQQAS